MFAFVSDANLKIGRESSSESDKLRNVQRTGLNGK